MSRSLDEEQVHRFREAGILFPLPALSREEVDHYLACVLDLEARLGGRFPRVGFSQPQLHFRWAYDLATRPRVVRAAADLIGPDLIVHSASIFCKHPGDGQFVAWHQDGHYWHLSAPRLISAWIALTPSTPRSGCLRVVPGTHHRRLPHREEPSEGHMLGSGLTLAEPVDPLRVVDVCLEPGEMSLHHERLVHGSEPNRAEEKRVGFAIRYLAADVTQELPHHEVIVAAGRVAPGHFRILAEPPPDDSAEGLGRQAAFAEANLRRRREGRR